MSTIVPPSLSPGLHSVVALPAAAAPASCRNCAAPLAGPYCAECGQRHHEQLDPSLRELAQEAGEELLHLDGKLGATVRLLLTSPGRLTREYLDGRRARYLSPLRLYLTCSVLFFFVMTVVPRRGDLGIAMTAQQTPAGTVHRELTAAERDSLAQMFERKARKVGGVWAVGLRGFARAESDPDGARGAMVAAMPKIMFVLVPFFALVTGLVYRRRRLHYPTHLSFALHVFAFYFLVSAAARAVSVAHVDRLTAIATVLVLLGTLTYLAIAMRRVYGGRVLATGARLAALLTVFGAGFFVVILVSGLLVLGRR